MYVLRNINLFDIFSKNKNVLMYAELHQLSCTVAPGRKQGAKPSSSMFLIVVEGPVFLLPFQSYKMQSAIC
jgi:hypothetical protein